MELTKKEKIKFNIIVLLASAIIIAYGWLLGYIVAKVQDTNCKDDDEFEKNKTSILYHY